MTIVDAKLELDADDTVPKSNVNVLDGNVTLRNVTFGKTHSNNIRVDGGLLNLENIVIPGHVEGSPENVHGLYTPGGEVIAKDLTITGTTGAGLRNTAGKVTVENLKIENVGSHTLYISGGETKLTNATIGKTCTNNVALHDGKLDCKIMVGGAVLTPEYAKKIGADWYAKDAKQSADIAKEFFGV